MRRWRGVCWLVITYILIIHWKQTVIVPKLTWRSQHPSGRKSCGQMNFGNNFKCWPLGDRVPQKQYCYTSSWHEGHNHAVVYLTLAACRMEVNHSMEFKLFWPVFTPEKNTCSKTTVFIHFSHTFGKDGLPQNQPNSANRHSAGLQVTIIFIIDELWLIVWSIKYQKLVKNYHWKSKVTSSSYLSNEQSKIPSLLSYMTK